MSARVVQRVDATTPPEQWPALLTMDEVVALSRFGQTTVYREIKAGRLRAVRPMRRLRVRRDDFLAWLEGGSEA